MTFRSFAPKDPDEVDYFEISFADRMPPSDTIASVLTVFLASESPDNALLIDEIAASAQSVSARWQGGTAGADYYITARVTTAQGRTLDKTGHVLVIDT